MNFFSKINNETIYDGYIMNIITDGIIMEPITIDMLDGLEVINFDNKKVVYEDISYNEKLTFLKKYFSAIEICGITTKGYDIKIPLCDIIFKTKESAEIGFGFNDAFRQRFKIRMLQFKDKIVLENGNSELELAKYNVRKIHGDGPLSFTTEEDLEKINKMFEFIKNITVIKYSSNGRNICSMEDFLLRNIIEGKTYTVLNVIAYIIF